MLAEPSSAIAHQDGVPHQVLADATVEERAEAVLAARPGVLLLGTSVQSVVERALIRRLRTNPVRTGRDAPTSITTLSVLDAMLFVERRFGADLAELPDLVACPDEATAHRLTTASAPASALIVTGNPTLEEIWLTHGEAPPPTPPHCDGEGSRLSGSPSPPRQRGGQGEGPPIDVLFVSSPVAAMRLRGAIFVIDEREALEDLLQTLASLSELAPGGYRVRVRLHPVQRSEGLPPPPPGISLLPDDDPDRLRSCAEARVVVGLSSTLLGEARFLSRPAVAYLPGPFWEHERVFAPEYGVPLARSRDHLRTLLTQALGDPPAAPPLAGHLGAAGRIVDLLLPLLAPSESPTR
jgi:hypothetical protein